MLVFVDTSALCALLNANDVHHPQARAGWSTLAAQRARLVTTNDVLVATPALVGQRGGARVPAGFRADPPDRLGWEELHRVAVDALLTAGERDLILVACVSFAAARQPGLETACAFDAHLVLQGSPALAC